MFIYIYIYTLPLFSFVLVWKSLPVRLPTQQEIMVASPKVVEFVYQGLADVAKVLKDLGIDWVVTCGTLLGGWRNGGFLRHDNDVDISVFPSDRRKFMSGTGQEVLQIWHMLDFVVNYEFGPLPYVLSPHIK